MPPPNKPFGPLILFTYEVSHRMGFKLLNVMYPVQATEYVYRVEPEDGGTRLTLDGEIEMVHFIRFGEGLMGKMYVNSNGGELNKAKQLLEAG